jgi:uncharacterized protein (TIGR02147 family)
MDSRFFQFESYRDFLKDRFAYLKSVKPSFSARAFAQRAGIGSPSYFGLVVSGQRHLSAEYAERFAQGLGLSKFDGDCLKLACALEQCDEPKRRRVLLGQLATFKAKAEAGGVKMPESHVKILADLTNLKLYLLAQSTQFKLRTAWLLRHFPAQMTPHEMEKRVALLLSSGLWVMDGAKVKTMAPTIRSGDELAGLDLQKTHANLLDAAKSSLAKDKASERVFGGRTFLFDKQKLGRVQEKIEAFKRELEAECEDLAATSVYELHVAFFELEKP